MSKISGGCLCGKVRFEMQDEFAQFHLCHCVQCQKMTGSAHAANLFTAPMNINWLEGADWVKRFDVPGRSLTKAFCFECGTGLPFISGSGKVLIVPVGSLDTAPSIAAQDNIFWSERAAWYDAALNATHFEKFPS